MIKEIPVKDLPDTEIAWCECGDAMPKELKICINCQFVKDMLEEEMTEAQGNINGDICAMGCALGALIDCAGQITPEDKTRLSRLYIQFGDLLSEIVEDET